MPLKLLSSGGGSVLLTANTTASNFTVNVPAVNGNMVTTADTGSITQGMLGAGVYAGYGPAFSAYLGSTQGVITASTDTKVRFNTKYFDTANCYDATTNYRFTPNVAGYYHLCGRIRVDNSPSRVIIYLYKNGSYFQAGSDVASSPVGLTFTHLVYANGTTDYFEMYVWASGTNPTISATGGDNVFNGYLVRAA